MVKMDKKNDQKAMSQKRNKINDKITLGIIFKKFHPKTDPSSKHRTKRKGKYHIKLTS